MNGPVRQLSFDNHNDTRNEQLVTREWLVTAGNGSYACGTLGFVPTRRHHGLLIANQPAPRGRWLSLVQLRDEILPDGQSEPVRLWGLEQVDGVLNVHGSQSLKGFELRCGFPIWTYDVQGVRIEKSIVMPYRSEAVCVRYTIDGDTSGWRMNLRPVIQFRGHNDSVATHCDTNCEASGKDRYRFEERAGGNSLEVKLTGAASRYVPEPQTDRDCFYRVEQTRGYDHVGDLQSPGVFEIDLSDLAEPNQLTFLATMDEQAQESGLDGNDPFEIERKRREQLIHQVAPIDSQSVEAELVLAADQFLMTPAKRSVDQADRDSETPEPERRSVIAGYPWFTDWGRDTMISLPGLTLATGRTEDARQILLTFADYIQDGLIPNLFPEGGQVGMYHTADATLWFFQAIDQYERASGDTDLVARLFPKLTAIIQSHLKGTLFGIHVDPADDLLVQGQDGVQLTWMDAKAGDWVVTPRRGKAVEINALWYNALHLYNDWSERLGAEPYTERSKRTRRSFNDRFWYDDGSYLYDVVDGESGNDPSLRPNQLFAISLTHPILDQSRWENVLQSCVEYLLTPVGLRSLAETSQDYIGVYCGDVYKRDAAYHQGTVWSWLLGPMVKAWCRTHPDRFDQPRTWLQGLEAHMNEGCIGQISEIFSGDPPHEPKGCFAQAWGVAELFEAFRLVNGSGK